MENKIKVQIVQPVVPTYRVPLFKALFNDDRFEVHIMAAKEEPYGVTSVEAFHPNIDLTHDISLIFNKLMWQKKLVLLPQMRQGDVLIINGNIKFLSNYRLIAEAKRRKIAVVWWGHAWSSTTTQLSFYVRLKIMKIADFFLVYTEKEKQMLIEQGFEGKIIHFMNNTIDTSLIFKIKKQVTADKIERFKAENKLTGKRVLLFTGRLKRTPSVYLDDALKALSMLNSEGDKYILLVIGDGTERENLRDLAQKLKVDKSVLFLGAIYNEETLAPWFLSADCFVFPGAIGLSLLHAFAYGLPVITHNIIKEHNPEIAALKNGKNGLLFKKNDPVDLAKKISNMFSDIARFRKRAYLAVTDEYSYEKLIGRVKDCIVEASALKRN
ncbi:glycosyltransferase family 4 protein [Desulfobacterota bacterium M19]